MHHLHTVFIVSSSLTVTTKLKKYYFVPKIFLLICYLQIANAPLVKKYNSRLITGSRWSVTTRGYQIAALADVVIAPV